LAATPNVLLQDNSWPQFSLLLYFGQFIIDSKTTKPPNLAPMRGSTLNRVIYGTDVARIRTRRILLASPGARRGTNASRCSSMRLRYRNRVESMLRRISADLAQNWTRRILLVPLDAHRGIMVDFLPSFDGLHTFRYSATSLLSKRNTFLSPRCFSSSTANQGGTRPPTQRE